MATIRVLSAEGEEIIWPHAAAAEQAIALKDWIDDTGGGGVFKGTKDAGVSAPALRGLSAFSEQCGAAFASGGEAAHDAAASAWAAEERSLAELAQLLHGVNFLEMPSARQVLSLQFCARLAGKGPDALAALLGAACDLSDEERQTALSESIFEPEAPSDATTPSAPQPPPLAHSVSLQLNDDAIEEALSEADVPTLFKLKGVSRSWRARARRVLCARLYTAKGRPVPNSHAEVTDINVEPFLKADGPGVTHVTEAMARLPNLARMHAHGFLVDVAAVRGLGPAPEFDRYERNDVLQPVRGCISGEDEPPGGLLLAVRAARYGEAHVPEGAFFRNATLVSIEVPAGFTSIGDGAFDGCSSLASVELPAGFTSIGEWAFGECSSLASIEVHAGLTTIGDGAFDGCSSLASVELPASLTSIGDWTFDGCSLLASIELPAGLTRIGDYAFRGCSSLASVEVPAGLTRIGDWTFDGCSSLASVELLAGLTTIGEQAFFGCSSLASIELPAGLTTIGEQAFFGCWSLASVELPAGLTSIGDDAFCGCSSLASIEVPASLTSIGLGAFHGCSSLASVELPASLTGIGDYAFPDTCCTRKRKRDEDETT